MADGESLRRSLVDRFGYHRRILMRFVRLLSFAAVLASASATVHALAAEPQVSETEKSAARQLYREGAQLQQDGKYADALDKFERAQRVYPAPTNLLRIAQCQAMLGRLVESLASYRAVVNFDLPAGSPAPFHQAVDEAKAEMPQVEPRVPRIKVDVSPATAPGLEVRLDGKPINAALVGEPLPLDPGSHTVAVSAPGYASDEQAVTVKERDTKSVAFTLRADASTAVAAPPPPASSSGATEPPPPPPIEKSGSAAAAARAKKSILLGVRLGVDVPGGDLEKNAKIDNSAGAGAAAGLEAGVRLFDHLYLGLFAEAAGYAQGSSAGSLVGASGGAIDATSTASGTFAGFDIGWITNAHKVGAMFDIGLGYRSLTIDTQLNSAGVSSQDIKHTYSGGEAFVGGGLFIKASSWLRVEPKITIGFGPFTKRSVDCSSGGAIDCATLTGNNASINSNQQSGHAFVFVGVSGFYNIDLK